MKLRPEIGETYRSGSDKRVVVGISRSHVLWRLPMGEKVHRTTLLNWAHWLQHAQKKSPMHGKPVKRNKIDFVSKNHRNLFSHLADDDCPF